MDHGLAKVATAAALLSTWTCAEAAPLEIELSSSRPITNSYLVIDCCGSGAPLPVAMGNFSPGSTSRGTGVDGSMVNFSGFIGIAADTGSVIVSWGNASPPVGNFFTVFGESEPLITDYLLTGNTGEISAFMNRHWSSVSKSRFDSGQSGLYAYSIVFPVGGYKLNAVPEPASMSVLGLGVFAVLRRRKK